MEEENRFEELAAGYVLGSLNEEEEKEFEDLLEKADETQLELLEDLKKAATHLALSSDPADPSIDVKESILDQINEKQYADETRDESYKIDKAKIFGVLTPSQAAATLVATLILLLSSIFYAFNLYWQLNQKTEQLVQVEDQIIQKENILHVLSSPKIKTVVMNSQESTQPAYGKLIWDPVEMEAILQISKLPPLSEDQHYQLWLMRGDDVQSVTQFTIQDTTRDQFFKIDKLADRYEAANATFAITREPVSNPEQPTGQIVLIGKHQAPPSP